MTAPAVFELRNASKQYDAHTTALQNVSLTVAAGARLAIVGGSGSGKTTLLNTLLGIVTLSSGECLFRGAAIDPARAHTLKRLRAETGVIFQDPGSGFNPFLPLRKSLLEPAKNQRNRDQKLAQLLAQMHLPADAPERFPHEFSGGQRQRLAAVRALITDPAIVIADEPVSALDVLARQQFISAISSAVSSRKITFITVTHDLAIVPLLADTIAVLKDGEIVEQGEVERVLRDPQHPYTTALTRAAGGILG
ncbi:ABC transporter ATP-binding protein [Canibacter sp. lx-72]|uniref:ABC transporter ATP-binding protein n=1 Tax=Canibacter zhuwentaonis TaxID=2837491 RepID=UPI001BDC74F3|nr:ABC transporter ATP-binding protein [Canibacter zhuwentaonis]MBT1017542.1 ABC transporter ATP-binding protein [Canibacter zhuwentaonis]